VKLYARGHHVGQQPASRAGLQSRLPSDDYGQGRQQEQQNIFLPQHFGRRSNFGA
jgi:hypothetical protein